MSDYEDDEFEDYADDFEEPEPAPSASEPKSASAAFSMSPAKSAKQDKKNTSSCLGENTSHEIAAPKFLAETLDTPSKKLDREATTKILDQNESDQEHSFSSVPPARTAKAIKRAKKFSPMDLTISIRGVSTNPRAKRLASLVSSGVLELQETKSTLINIAPSSKSDLYHRMIRATDSIMRQSGVPNRAEYMRDSETNTEEILMVNKGVQYSYGDDTALLNATDSILSRREGGISILSDPFHSETEGIVSDINFDSSSSSSRLTLFVQRASVVLEKLMGEQRLARSDSVLGENLVGGSKLFSDTDHWVQIGRGSMSGALELIRGRPCSCVKFNPSIPNMLLTVHPADESLDEDLRPYKGIMCVWDISLPSTPVWILECSGFPTCACFSSAQSFFILAGTLEGVVYLWDLREPASYHRDRDAIDLGVDRGIRKPSYSSAFGLSDFDYNGDDIHTLPVTQVESMGVDSSSVGYSSHFFSVDNSGSITLWMTVSNDHATEALSSDVRGISQFSDFGVSPWSHVRLIRNRIIRAEGGISSKLMPTMVPPIVCTIPGDDSSLLLGSSSGDVRKLSRFGSSMSPASFVSYANDKIEMDIPSGPSCGTYRKLDTSYASSVCCLSVNNFSSPRNLILVAHMDGTVDLFRVDMDVSLQRWDFHDFIATGEYTTCNILFIRWLPNHPAKFIVITDVGVIYTMDLLKNPYHPIATERSFDENMGLVWADMSTPSTCGKSLYLILCTPGDNSKGVEPKLWLRKIGTDLRAEDGDEEKLLSHMNSWIGRVYSSSVLLSSSTSDARTEQSMISTKK